jgi:enoyl-CoA hydratase/carnithine racemase
MEEPMTDSVLVQEHRCGGGRIGHLTLNVPKTLNSLTLDMVDVISDCLDSWASDDDVVAVFIDGSGEKAFCAGGDVAALRESSLATPGGPCEYAETFFAREYAMNYRLHTYPKPVVCWGQGVVMGGGLGILAACSHPIVGERTRIAMPEITIALFPDVGGSWFLNRMPGHVGRFLALTAVHINGVDAVDVGLANYFLAASQHQQVLDALIALEWPNDNAARHARASELLRGLGSDAERPPAQVMPHKATIDQLMAGEDLASIAQRLLAWEGEDVWLTRARDGFAHGSKLAASWIFRQLNLTRDADLKTVFESEAQLGANIMRYPEFAEGVRALLIEKDRNPQWEFAAVDDVPAELLDRFFAPAPGAPSVDFVEYGA